MTRISRTIALIITPMLFTSCIPYAVGTTARPVPEGEFQPNLSAYVIPNGIESVDSDGTTGGALAYASADFEGRWGLSDRSDLGLRVPAGSGAIVTYKRLISGVNDPAKPAVSTIVGAGVVNFGNHGYIEGGVIASGREDQHVPYGGVRVMHVLPLNASAVSDTPTAGAFGGIRFRLGTNFAMSPELGVYYDESALELRKRNVIFIPSLTFHWK